MITAIEIEFLVGLFMAGPALADLLNALTAPTPEGSKKSLPRSAMFAFLVGVALCVLAYFKISLLG